MILITVGTEKFPFDRLMNWVNNLIEQNVIHPEQEEIIVQYGSCTIVPQGVKGYSCLPGVEFQKLVENARLIIAHCGEGSIDLLAKIAKPFILVPRSRSFSEHVDDHQVELAEIMEEKGVPVANCFADLVNFIAAPKPVKITNTPAAHYSQVCSLLEKKFGDRVAIKTEENILDNEIIIKIKSALNRSISSQNQQYYNFLSAAN